jgi:hypothetical protein
VQEARRSQFLEGDIGLAQRSFDLNRQGLKLRQEQIDFNKKMLVANTVIQGTQAAVSLTQAAAGLGKAIGDYHNQKTDLDIKTGTKTYRAGMEHAIMSGYVPYKLDDNGRMELDRNGNPIYIGVDDFEYTYTLENGTEVTKRLGDIKQDVINKVGGNYWTNSGAERGMQIAINAFEDIEMNGQMKLADEVRRQQNEALEQELDLAYRSGDLQGAIDAISVAPHLSVTGKADKIIEQEKKFGVGKAGEEAKRIAIEKDMDAARTHLEEHTYEAGGKQIALSEAEKAQALIEAEKARDGVLNISKEMIDRHWHDRLAELNSFSLERLKNEKRILQSQRDNFIGCENEMSYNRFMREIDREIEQKNQTQAARSGGSASAIKAEAEREMADIYARFNMESGPLKMTGVEAIQAMQGIREHSPGKAEEYEKQILFGGSNPAAEQVYHRLNSIIDAFKNKNATADEKIEYDNNASKIKEAIFQARFNGASSAELTQLVEGYRREMASDVLQEAFQKGNIGSTGMFGAADKTATAFAYHSARDNLDLRYSNRTLDARRPDKTSPLTVGGEKAETVMQQAAAQNQQWANKELERKGIQLTSIDYEKDSKGDPDGRVSYRGSDGNKYRVNAESERGSRYLERFENNRWVKEDLKNIPDIPRSNRTEASREAGLLANMDHLPMPPGYTGRSDDVMMRQEFISSYGLNRYKQFLDEQGISWR